jgi:hypothetical protein
MSRTIAVSLVAVVMAVTASAGLTTATATARLPGRCARASIKVYDTFAIRKASQTYLVIAVSTRYYELYPCSLGFSSPGKPEIGGAAR